ncbi:MAG: bifunctional precorrin-2 dehydrogenase/sirohydrochlorin ferrochelatase [Ferruginibacter sp.]
MPGNKAIINKEAGNEPGRPDVNHLFPIFLKLEDLKLLIVGGGYVGMEKLSAVLQNSPATSIKLVALSISEEIRVMAQQYPAVQLAEKRYEPADMEGINIVIAALNDRAVSEQVCADAKAKNILVNAADKPELCDFYLSSVVQKGNLKIAVSTNGKSPTIAKRVKEVLNDVLPAEIDELLDNMQKIRNKLSGDFADKVKQLNEITKKLSEDK